MCNRLVSAPQLPYVPPVSRVPNGPRWRQLVVGRALALCATLVDLVYPQDCCGCGTTLPPGANAAFCTLCMPRIRTVRPPWCPTCGQPFDRTQPEDSPWCNRCLATTRPFRRARSWAYYSTDAVERNPLTRALWALKYDRRADVGHRLGRLLAEHCAFRAGQHDLVVPVPLHRQRLRWRGFNHACLLAAPIARRLSTPLAPGIVRRARATPPQVSLPVPARWANVRGAFTVPGSRRVAGRRILLVDDVYTTGATVGACATALARAGATSIDVLTAARTVS